ncbi:MAG: hypothetical protein JO222_11375 [Frankiales bacterium]|nr:hypothetical protein [Frankiales bacterium]
MTTTTPSATCPVDLALVAEVAALAPSVHNSQPWQFVVGDGRLDIYGDPTRRLRSLDPDLRLLHISCGAAAELARLAIRSAGRAADIDWRPDPGTPMLLARIRVGEPQPASDLDRELVAAIPRRYTDRGPYDGNPVAPDLVAEMTHAVSSYGLALRLVQDSGERATLAMLLSDAENAEATDTHYAEEIGYWVHAGADGVPIMAVAPWPDHVVPDLPLRQWLPDGRHLHLPAGGPPEVLRDTVVTVVADGDGPLDWLTTGAAVAWLQLRATVDGLATQPLGPATDFAAARIRLARDLGLVGHPQFVMRIGRGSGRPWTGRRDPSEVTIEPKPAP